MDALHFLHGSEIPQCRAIVDKRFAGYCALQFIYDRSINLRYNSKHSVLEAPYIWPCNPGPHIYFEAHAEHWYHFHIAVTGPCLDQWRQDGLWPELPVPVANPEQVVNDWRQLLELFRDTDPWQQRRAINILEKILLDCLPQDKAAPEPHWLIQAKEALERGLDQQASARACGMAVSTFRRRFTDALGICPQDWIMQQRIDQARQLLEHEHHSMLEIAETLGFYDAAHFARQFKQRVGISPRDYRSSTRFM